MTRNAVLLWLVTVPLAAQAQSTPGNWKVSTDEGQALFSLSVTAEPGRPVTPCSVTAMVSLRCKAGEVGMVVVSSPASQAAPDDPGKVLLRVRFDDSEEKTVAVRKGMPGVMLTFPDPKATIEAMARSKDMFLEVTPQGCEPQLVRFDVRGLSLVLPKLKDACGWK